MSISALINSCLNYPTKSISNVTYQLILCSFLVPIIVYLATLVGKALFKHNSGDRKKEDEGTATGKNE